jgi:thymidylate kinase
MIKVWRQEEMSPPQAARRDRAALRAALDVPAAPGSIALAGDPRRLASTGPMIIELFGPPAVGKTTFARALVAALEERGVAAEIMASFRPAEQGGRKGKGGLGALGVRLSAPLERAGKLYSAAFAADGNDDLDHVTRGLLSILPPRNWLRAARLRRYLSALHRSWVEAQSGRRAVVFDQGYLCALCALFTVASRADPKALAEGFELVPVPDLLIRLEAPREVLEARLRRRLARQTLLERVFEHSVETSLRQREFAAALDDLLARRGQRPLHFGSIEQGGATAAADAVVEAISRRRSGMMPTGGVGLPQHQHRSCCGASKSG